MKAPLLSVEEVQARLLDAALCVKEIETVSLDEALSRVLAVNQTATLDVPPTDNSAMDGYAVCFADLNTNCETTLPVTQYIAAGHTALPLQVNSAARIFTGAPLPTGADTIVLQENCTAQGDNVVILFGEKSGQHIRKQGSDTRAGQTVLQKGTLLRAQELGVLASIGVNKIPVYRRLRVAICSTGDELVEPGELLPDGKIYNSNRFVLKGLLRQLNIDVIDLGCVQDTPECVRDTFLKASEQADCLITSGGVSEGDKDFVKSVVSELGKVHLWKLASKPGKPFLFGSLTGANRDIAFFGLPGNPVSVFVTFLALVKPYLLKCQGMSDVLPVLWKVKSTFEWETGARQEYIRVKRNINQNGESELSVYATQDSAVFSSVTWASGLAVISPHTKVAIGDIVAYMALEP